MMNQGISVVMTEAENLPQEIRMRCSGIIAMTSAACGLVGAGLAQVPGSDSAVIVPLQIKMVQDIARQFGLEVTESSIEAFVVSAAATAGGRALSQWLLRWFPGVGNTINGLTAAGVTELVGWVAAINFSQRGNLF